MVFVLANEHSIVMLRVLIQQIILDTVIDDLCRNAARPMQVCKHATVAVILWRQGERCALRRLCSVLCLRGGDRLKIFTGQRAYCILKTHAMNGLKKTDCIAAALVL